MAQSRDCYQSHPSGSKPYVKVFFHTAPAGHYLHSALYVSICIYRIIYIIGFLQNPFPWRLLVKSYQKIKLIFWSLPRDYFVPIFHLIYKCLFYYAPGFLTLSLSVVRSTQN